MLKYLLLTTPGNPATGQVVGTHLHRDFVTRQNSDKIHSEFSGNMCQNGVAISNIYLECCVGQCLYDGTLDFDHIGFCQVLSLLVWITSPADLREGPAELAVGYGFSASDFFGGPGVGRPGGFHVLALLPLGPLHPPAPAVRQQEEVPVYLQNEEQVSPIPAGGRSYNIGSCNVHIH